MWSNEQRPNIYPYAWAWASSERAKIGRSTVFYILIFYFSIRVFRFLSLFFREKKKTPIHFLLFVVPRRVINADGTMHAIARDRRVFVCCDVKVRFIPFIFPPLLVSLMALLCRFSSFLSLCPPQNATTTGDDNTRSFLSHYFIYLIKTIPFRRCCVRMSAYRVKHTVCRLRDRRLTSTCKIFWTEFLTMHEYVTDETRTTKRPTREWVTCWKS